MTGGFHFHNNEPPVATVPNLYLNRICFKRKILKISFVKCDANIVRCRILRRVFVKENRVLPTAILLWFRSSMRVFSLSHRWYFECQFFAIPIALEIIARRSGRKGFSLDAFILSATPFDEFHLWYDDGTWDRTKFAEKTSCSWNSMKSITILRLLFVDS